MTGRFLAALAIAALAGGPAEAGETRGVVELFTSQGCASCPPADAALDRLSGESGVVALAYHVDYWDYLGWKDTLARPENAERQRGYARTFGVRAIYTPQAVLNGRSHVNGADERAVAQALDGGALPVEVRLSLKDDRIVAETSAGAPVEDSAVVFVWFKAETATAVQRGENRGRIMRYVNSVVSVATTGMYDGAAGRFEMPVTEADKAGADGCAVLVQELGPDGAPGAILGAALTRL